MSSGATDGRAGPMPRGGGDAGAAIGEADLPGARARAAVRSRTLARSDASIARIAAVVCVLVAAVLWLGPWLVRADLFDDDGAHHVFWYYQYADPALLTEELSLEYFTSPSVSPPGYRALYASLAPVVDVLRAAEWLSVVLLAATAAFAYLLGRAAVPDARYREIAGLAMAAITLALLARIDLLPPMALQRAFAMPLTLMCLWALVARRYAWVGASWLLAALVYPVIVPVLGLAAGLVFLRDLARDRAMPPKWILNAVLGAAAVTIVLLGLGVPPDVGPTVTWEQARQMPEFGPGGRQVLFGQGWQEYIFVHHRTGIGVSPKILLGAGLAALAAVVLRRRRWIPLPAIVMAGTGLALWGIARLTLFDLYLPNRHSRWTLAAAVLLVLAVGATAVFARIVQRLHSSDGAVRAGENEPSTPLPRSAVLSAAIVAPLLVAAALYPAAAKSWRTPVDADLERAYAFLATLPKDALVAAHPDLANYVPLRTRRAVLASTEASVAFVVGYYAKYVPRIEASLDAAYATDWNAFDARLAPYGVDVFLSNAATLERTDYHPPFAARVAKLTEAKAPDSFVLREPPPERVLFRSGDTVVVAVRGPHGFAADQREVR
jgi:hypothetical protein